MGDHKCDGANSSRASGARLSYCRLNPVLSYRRVSGGLAWGAAPGDPAGQAEVAAFVKALAELGWVEGRNVAFAYRWSGSDIALAEIFAKELIASNPDILVARSTPPTMALKSATTTIPIVFVNVTEPISSGIVPNLVRPRGNMISSTMSSPGPR